MDIRIKKEEVRDYKAVETVIMEAFKELEISEQNEHLLVSRLRKSDAFIPELSLVAEANGQIIGHVLLTKLKIKQAGQENVSLSLAPISVLPMHQKKGIGAKLMEEAHLRAKTLGYSSIILIGHPEYYPRFGYQKLDKSKLSLPFEAPDEACMILELIPGSTEYLVGKIEYPREFFD